MSERQGVEIDYCPQCRGVWLDRGELDKILERAQTEVEAYTQQVQPGSPATPAAAAPHEPAQRGYEAPRYADQRSEPSRYDEPRYDEPRYDDSRYGERRGDARYGDGRYGDARSDDRRRDPRYGRRKKQSPFDFLGDIFD